MMMVAVLQVELEFLISSYIKVQHTHLTDRAAVDTATVELVVNILHWIFPAFDYR
jgi:hypothetical protein